MRVVHDEDSPLSQYQRSVVAVVVQAVLGIVRPFGQEVQITRIVAMNQVDRQPQSDDGMQCGRRY